MYCSVWAEVKVKNSTPVNPNACPTNGGKKRSHTLITLIVIPTKEGSHALKTSKLLLVQTSNKRIIKNPSQNKLNNIFIHYSKITIRYIQRGGSIYIMTNKNRSILYIGVTSNLKVRILQHKEHYFKGSFTDKYNLEYCIYYENFSTIEEAILREKQLKKWRREKKLALIDIINKEKNDLWCDIQEW